MLVLLRKVGQELVIGDPKNPYAVVKVLKIDRKGVRLGIKAMDRLKVHRREVADAILAEQEAAPDA